MSPLYFKGLLNDASVRTAAMTIDAVHLALFPGIARKTAQLSLCPNR
jgi:hypothetical protein